ncbi:Zn(2)-Cys(6) zinc finger domain protein [Metarhizium robertsii]|uniref:Zn(2)-Cys(6) zinc finger domain protein n=1 Tax=Metarhizium robertsii TaxID=568076 RepID=A0A0A1UMY2_9HYPO|nr:Zn(2)-Cys(6) zinc finger domain protein [Metarhizium robertsii]
MPADQTCGRVARSRNGCVTCRARRIKCDETRPSCRQCATRGQDCGGYRLHVRWSTKHESRPVHRAKHQSSPTWLYTARKSQPAQCRQLPAEPDATPAYPALSESESQLTSTTACSSSSADAPFDCPRDETRSVLDLGLLGLVSRLAWDPFNTSSSSSNSAIDGDWTHAGPTAFSGWDSDEPAPNNEDTALYDTEVTWSTVSQESTAFSDDSGCFDTDLDARQPLVPISTVAHGPYMMVEYWFRDICPLWSQYDSESNFNRTIAAALWSNCEAVQLSLQAMSTAYLASKVPTMKDMSFSMMKAAAEVITADLHTINSHQLFDTVPVGLLYSLLCIGTSICWLNAGQLGLPFLSEAKALLYNINQHSDSLPADQRQLLQFFNKSWLYVEMLLSMVLSNCKSLQAVEGIGEADVRTCIGPDLPLVPVDDFPHPWTGICSTSLRLFTRTMKLCHRFRHAARTRATFASAHVTSAMRLMEQATSVEEQLLALDLSHLETGGKTDDSKTPNQHLVRVGEAYRQAGLLQLYQTFPDLLVARYSLQTTAENNAHFLWHTWITPIALQLVTLLKGLPGYSGSKMTQPLLCITASSGLRLQRPLTQRVRQSQTADSSDKHIEHHDMLQYIEISRENSEREHEEQVQEDAESTVLSARQFIRDRLKLLKTVLPSKPVLVAEELVEAIWRAYDGEHSLEYATHWIDIMERENLKSNFA